MAAVRARGQTPTPDTLTKIYALRVSLRDKQRALVECYDSDADLDSFYSFQEELLSLLQECEECVAYQQTSGMGFQVESRDGFEVSDDVVVSEISALMTAVLAWKYPYSREVFGSTVREAMATIQQFGDTKGICPHQ